MELRLYLLSDIKVIEIACECFMHKTLVLYPRMEIHIYNKTNLQVIQSYFMSSIETLFMLQTSIISPFSVKDAFCVGQKKNKFK